MMVEDIAVRGLFLTTLVLVAYATPVYSEGLGNPALDPRWYWCKVHTHVPLTEPNSSNRQQAVRRFLGRIPGCVANACQAACVRAARHRNCG
ncbi:hypothetical protein LSTR_LSTR005092, partial [Laodelphax striatellus]